MRESGLIGNCKRILGAALVITTVSASASGQPDPATPSGGGSVGGGPARLSCSSVPGGREHCAADTSAGVALLSSSGRSPCLLGKSWGYDDRGIWVSDGCGGEFLVGARTAVSGPQEQEPIAAAPPEAAKEKSPEYIPNRGFRLFEGEKGQLYLRLFTYVRYLNQKSLDDSYTDSFGNTKSVQLRQDFQLNKFFLPLSGWFLDPNFRYYLYVWSSNPSQGDPAQVVGAGNISYTFSRYFTLGGGITSLPTVRSTEGNFPYWLGVDARMTADEFFRGSYTTGIWLKGQLAAGLNYQAMLANNLSTLGVSAAQLDNGLNTWSLMMNWLPTTGENGYMGEFGDYERHDKLATRVGAHYTHSREDRQSQPGANSIENSQIRLTDGSVIFTPELFGPGITVEQVDYDMTSLDGGLKYRGFSLEAEFYWRWLGDYSGSSVEAIEDIDDHGFQLQASAMVLPEVLQAYAGVSAIYGDYGNASEFRAGGNWYPFRKREIRVNAEWLHLNDCPVGYTAVPYAVGGNGDVLHANVVMTF